MADQASTDPATEKLKNLNIQDYDTTAASFDPFAPQGVLDTMQQDLDLLGGAGNLQMDNNLSNGHGGAKNISFDDVAFGLPDPGFVKPDNQGQGPANARNMSSSELLGFQSDYGNNLNTGQMEYTCVSDDDENNLLDLDNAEGEGIPVTGCHGDQDYYMSTGQPLVELGNEGQPMDEVVGGEYDDNDTASADQTSHGVPDIVQINNQPANFGREEHFYDGYYQDNEELEGNVLDPGYLHPEADPERMRRSLSPERSLSPDHSRDAESASSFEQQCDNTETECAHFQRIQNDSETEHELNKTELPKRTKPSGIPSKCMSPARSEDSDTPGDNKPLPKHKLGQIPILQPSPKLKKRPLELPPWNDNVIVPLLPRARPTLIGKQSDVVSPTPRPKTAPIRHSVKDASSDSGVEEDRSTDVRKSTTDSRRKYGTDTKNQTYKPGGGNVKIFNEKIDTRNVGPRTDCTKPRTVVSPRGSQSSLKSPVPNKPPSPGLKNVSSKIGSLKNTKHSPGGGNVPISSQQKDYSNVSSRITSKTDHKPKGGDKKIEVKKLEWKAESKVGSLKNTAHSPGGGNIKVYDQKVEVKAQPKVGSTANIRHKAGGGEKKIETQKLEFKEKAAPKVGSLDKVKHQPGGGDIKILDEKVDFSTTQPKVGSLDKADHQPGGGDKKIEIQKLNFKETAQARTDSGPGSGVVKHRTGSSRSSRSGSITSQDSKGNLE